MNLAQASGILNFLETGTDVTVYFVMAMIATLLFVIRLVFALFIGDAGDSGDFDMDVQHAADLSGDAFQMFSLLSITAFFMGAGWMGFAARNDWGLGGALSLVLSVGVGVLMMLIASGMMFFIRKLSSHPQIDMQSARGQIGRVYMQIPDKGLGQVEVIVSGSKNIYPARSHRGAIDSFTQVLVTDVENDGTLVVELRADI